MDMGARAPKHTHASLITHLDSLLAVDNPPARLAGNADAVEAIEAKANMLIKQADAHRALPLSLAHDDA